jgi:hypothetical protein
MRQTACAWRFLPAMIGGGTWEGATPSMRRRSCSLFAVRPPLGYRRAQQMAMPIVGFLAVGRLRIGPQRSVEGWVKALWRAGMVNRIQRAEGNYERLPALTADLISSRASVLSFFTELPRFSQSRRRPRAFLSSSPQSPIRFDLAAASFNRPEGCN